MIIPIKRRYKKSNKVFHKTKTLHYYYKKKKDERKPFHKNMSYTSKGFHKLNAVFPRLYLNIKGNKKSNVFCFDFLSILRSILVAPNIINNTSVLQRNAPTKDCCKFKRQFVKSIV